MDPVIVHLGPVSVHWYGLFMAIAMITGLFLSMNEAKRRNLSEDMIVDLLLWALPAAIIGARLYYVVFHWSDEYRALSFFDIIAVWQGGLAIHGGLIGAFIAGYFFSRKHRVSYLLLADCVAPSIIIGQAIGRWGNFMNQEAYGGPVSRSFLENMHLPGWIIEQMHIFGVYYHPTFLYESIWNVLGFVLLMSLRFVNLRRGSIFFSYLIWYSLGRFFIEGLRTDSLTFQGPSWLAELLQWIWSPMELFFQPGEMTGGNIRAAQLMSIMIILGIMLWMMIRRYIDCRDSDSEGVIR